MLGTLMDQLAAAVPRGRAGEASGTLPASGQMQDVLAGGACYALKHGYGVERDLLRCEDEGAVADADPGQVSTRAMERGLRQVGSLGSGNHFLEVQAVDLEVQAVDQVTTRSRRSDSGCPTARSAS